LLPKGVLRQLNLGVTPVLVTGCGGFLRSHLCKALLARGHAVTDGDCFADCDPRSLKQRNIATRRDGDVRLVNADLAPVQLLEGRAP
jgi:nucleoside-diphosphate-sugar epimerase